GVLAAVLVPAQPEDATHDAHRPGGAGDRDLDGLPAPRLARGHPGLGISGHGAPGVEAEQAAVAPLEGGALVIERRAFAVRGLAAVVAHRPEVLERRHDAQRDADTEPGDGRDLEPVAALLVRHRAGHLV